MLYTEQDINEEIWGDREHILSQTYPEDSAHEYADGAVPVYYYDIADTWGELDGEYQNNFHELTAELPERIEDLMRVDLYLYYQMLYSGAVQALIDGKVLNESAEWVDPEPEVNN